MGDAFEADAVGDLAHRAGVAAEELLGALEAEGADAVGPIVDGNLVIAAQVDVQEAGRFHLAGTLYTLQGEPVGTARAAAQLQPGRQWINLSFYGLMFHDRNVAGPFHLGALAFSATSRMPNALNDLVENAYVTKPFKLAVMTARPFGDVKLLDAAARLEAE